jgi:hypothetical protein
VQRELLDDPAKVRRKTTFRILTYLEGKPEEEKSMSKKAEDVGRHVRRRSASPVRMARLNMCRIRVPHDDTYIHHSMSEVVTPHYL